MQNFETSNPVGVGANRVRPDETDLAILRELVDNARLPNNTLASRVGVAPSTSLARVRALVESGVIRGFHADVDPDAFGLGIAAMISIRVHPHGRSRMAEVSSRLRGLPNVLNVYLLGGDTDFLVHVRCASPAHLRDFVADNLGADPDIADIHTDLIFEHDTAGGLPTAPATPPTSRRPGA